MVRLKELRKEKMIEVNSLWIGKSLTALEQMCLSSHIHHGHKFNLWCYNHISNVPDGVEMKDAREILPEDEVFAYAVGEGKGSYSAFSNFFRYKLLLDRGGWWVDMDVCCLKPFFMIQDRVFASERTKNGGRIATTCVIKTPPDDKVMLYCCQSCYRIDKRIVEWGEIGPRLLDRTVNNLYAEVDVLSVDTFCPIDWFDTNRFFEDKPIPDSYAIHLWNEMWRRTGKDKDSYQENTLYGRLRERYLPIAKKTHVLMM